VEEIDGREVRLFHRAYVDWRRREGDGSLAGTGDEDDGAAGPTAVPPLTEVGYRAIKRAHVDALVFSTAWNAPPVAVGAAGAAGGGEDDDEADDLCVDFEAAEADAAARIAVAADDGRTMERLVRVTASFAHWYGTDIPYFVPDEEVGLYIACMLGVSVAELAALMTSNEAHGSTPAAAAALRDMVTMDRVTIDGVGRRTIDAAPHTTNKRRKAGEEPPPGGADAANANEDQGTYWIADDGFVDFCREAHDTPETDVKEMAHFCAGQVALRLGGTDELRRTRQGHLALLYRAYGTWQEAKKAFRTWERPENRNATRAAQAAAAVTDQLRVEQDELDRSLRQLHGRRWRELQVRYEAAGNGEDRAAILESIRRERDELARAGGGERAYLDKLGLLGPERERQRAVYEVPSKSLGCRVAFGRSGRVRNP
jgi:hypothetical protein